VGVEAIVRAIEAEAEAEARRIVDGARREADERLAAAEAAAEAAVAAAAERLEAELRTELVRAVNAARRRRLDAEAAALVATLQAATEAARAELVALADADEPPRRDRWCRALRRWVEEALAVTGRPATIAARPVDLACLAELDDAELDGAELVAEPGLPPGCRVTGRDGRVEVEATLPVRLARAEVRCVETLARVLGLGPTTAASEPDRADLGPIEVGGLPR
jgi:vacuolar-type H+-ATPase subunit E/Vma4